MHVESFSIHAVGIGVCIPELEERHAPLLINNVRGGHRSTGRMPIIIIAAHPELSTAFKFCRS